MDTRHSRSAVLFILLAAVAGTGCKKEDAAPAPATGGGDKPFTVGFVYVGPRGDYGYNQAHAGGAAAVKEMAAVKMREEDNVPETLDVQKTMESMINLDGAS